MDPCPKSTKGLLRYIRNNIIGNNNVFKGPYGLRRVLYLDFIASGRGLQFIEDYIQKEVLPDYANTHTTTSVTSLQTTLYRYEARKIIRNACNANENDSVIFVGSGCTGAIYKMIHALDLKRPPVVFIGPYAHHSLFLPWLESGAKVIRIRQNKDGLVDIQYLQDMLQKFKKCSKQLIGCFSAASNITGILADVNNITITLHKYGALAFWDYATAAPYAQIDMNPVINSANQELVYKDAVFISTHKFVGGISTPGILVAKSKLFKSQTPEVCGGGTVVYVTKESRCYHQDPEIKEEGGTPAIVESIRAGLVFQLKEALSSKHIMAREEYLLGKALDVWNQCPNLVILGNTSVTRLPIFSFLIHHPGTGRFLHHNFVSAILNDVFGIQNRGGCACAGPYAMDLFDMKEETAQEIATMFLGTRSIKTVKNPTGKEILKPGFSRLNLPCFMEEEELQFVIEAVSMVAENGWKLLPQYVFNIKTGEWKQKSFQNPVVEERKSLKDITYLHNCMEYKIPESTSNGYLPQTLQENLAIAHQLFETALELNIPLPDQKLLFDGDTERYRWFLLPCEAQEYLHGNIEEPISLLDLPFCPKELKSRLGYEVSEEHCGNGVVSSELSWMETFQPMLSPIFSCFKC